MGILWELISNAKILGLTPDTLGAEPRHLFCKPALNLSNSDVPEV